MMEMFVISKRDIWWARLELSTQTQKGKSRNMNVHKADLGDGCAMEDGGANEGTH